VPANACLIRPKEWQVQVHLGSFHQQINLRRPAQAALVAHLGRHPVWAGLGVAGLDRAVGRAAGVEIAAVVPGLINATFGGMTLSPYTLGRGGFIASLDLPALMAIPPTLYLMAFSCFLDDSQSAGTLSARTAGLCGSVTKAGTLSARTAGLCGSVTKAGTLSAGPAALAGP